MSTKEIEWDGLPIPKRYGAILAIAMGITVSVLDGTIANGEMCIRDSPCWEKTCIEFQRQ